MTSSHERTEAFSAEQFRRHGHQVIDLLADYLARLQADGGASLPVLPPTTPAEMLARWPAAFADGPGPGLVDLLPRVLAQSNHLHHPRYVGHQVSAPLPVAALADLVAAFLNNGGAVFEMGPVSTAMERSLCAWLGGALGFPQGSDGIFTSGGSAGNLTALLSARQAQAGFDIWSQGAAAGPPLCVLTSTQTHYCVARAAKIMGLGDGGVVPVPVDEAFRLRADALPQAMAAAQAAGRQVFAVVASAGSTATGAYDPLPAIADFCQRHQLWLHVDGAHGASAALSPRYRHLTQGIEHADSVVWDAHKMLLMPALITTVLFRRGETSFSAFAQQASYLFHEGQRPADDPEWWNAGLRTLECTKRMMSLKLYVALSQYGARFFADYVSATYDLARRFAALLRQAGDFEVAVEPEANIVCFRHVPQGAHGARLDALQLSVRERLLADGSFYLVQTRLPGGLFLRTTLINAQTSESDLIELIAAIRAAARGG